MEGEDTSGGGERACGIGLEGELSAFARGVWVRCVLRGAWVKVQKKRKEGALFNCKGRRGEGGGWQWWEGGCLDAGD